MISQRLFKKVLVSIITIFVLMYITVFAICKFYLKPAELKSILVSKLEQKFKRTVTLSDDLNLGVSWNLSPTLTLHQVVIGNAPWATQSKMVSIEELNLKLSVWKLLFNTIYVDSLILTKPIVYLEANNNINNWEFEEKTKEPTDVKAQKNSAANLDINRISIEDGLLSFQENKDPARVLNIEKLNFNLSDDEINVKEMLVNIGASQLSGHIDIDTKNLNVEGTLSSSSLSMHDLSNTKQGSSAQFGTSNKASDEYTLSSTQLPIDKLKKADIDLLIKIKSLKFDNVNLENVNLKVLSKNKVLRIELDPPANLFNAKLALNIAYDLKGQVPTLSLDLKTNNLKLDNFVPISESVLDLNASLKSSGSSVQTLVANLDGKILATASPGSYLNSKSSFANVLSTILASSITFEKAKSSTEFECAVINMQVRKGVARTEEGIALEAATVSVVGSGEIDLRNGRLRISINPNNTNPGILGDVANLSMAQAVKLSGTITNPVVQLNPISMIANSALGKTLFSSLAAGLPGGISAIAGDLSNSQDVANKPKVSVCKRALEK